MAQRVRAALGAVARLRREASDHTGASEASAAAMEALGAEARAVYQRRLGRRVLSALGAYVYHRRRMDSLRARAGAHLVSFRRRRSVAAWRVWTAAASSARAVNHSRERRADAARSRHAAKRAIAVWRAAAAARAQLRALGAAAALASANHLLRAGFSRWVAEAAWAVEHRRQRVGGAVAVAAAALLRRRRLSRALRLFESASALWGGRRRARERAIGHYVDRLQRCCFGAWLCLALVQQQRRRRDRGADEVA